MSKYRIKESNPNGGKAGKGKNKTASIQVLNENNCIVKIFRYRVNKYDSKVKAFIRAQKHIRKLEVINE